MRCNDLLDKGHSTNKHISTCPVTKHRAKTGQEGDITGSPTSKHVSHTTTEFDDRPDNNIKHSKNIITVLRENIIEETYALGPTSEKDVAGDSNDKTIDYMHNNANKFDEVEQLHEPVLATEDIQVSNEMSIGDSPLDYKYKGGTKRKREHDMLDDKNVFMSSNEGKDEWLDEAKDEEWLDAGKDEEWLDETQQSWNISNFSADNYDVEDAVAVMYKFALLHSSYGNLGNPKAPPIVSDKDQTNVVTYIRATVQIKGGEDKVCWLTKLEAIEVNIKNRQEFGL